MAKPKDKNVKTAWDFRYDEEFPARKDIQFAGVLTDGSRFLFWSVTPPERGNMCRIHNSISLSDDSVECEYPWTAENDETLLGFLNGLADGEPYCGDDSGIFCLPFKEYGYATARVRFRDSSEGSFVIKLSQDYDDDRDGDVFHFCRGWHDLAAMMQPDDDAAFIVLDWSWGD